MKEKFEELYNFMKKNLELSEWAGSKGLEEWTSQLENEMDEMKAELEKKDMQEFKKELGDVFWDMLHLIGTAENQGIVNMHELLHEIHEKFKRRKPFLLENKSMKVDEELKWWKEIKQREKEEDNARD